MSSLKDVILSNIAASRANTFTSLPAIVTKVYNEGNSTVVDVNIAISRVGRMEDYGITKLTRVPLMWPKVNGCAIVMPIAVNDEVMLHFTMRDSGKWRYSDGKTPVLASTIVTQDVSDAYATPTTTTYATGAKIDPNAVIIDTGGTQIRITKDGNIELGKDASEQLVLGNTFMDLYNKMVDLVKTHTHPYVDTGRTPVPAAVTSPSAELASMVNMSASELSATNTTN